MSHGPRAHLGLVEERPAHLGIRPQDRPKQLAVTAADVDDARDPREVIGMDHALGHQPADLGHRRVERARGLGISGQALEGVLPRDERARALARLHAVKQRAPDRPHRSAPVQRNGPHRRLGVAPQMAAEGRQREAPIRLLGAEAEGRHGAQQPTQ